MANIIINDINVNIAKNKKNNNFINTNTSSPRLLNIVHPYYINGFYKTVFYTEVESNFKPDDIVYIINGNYDSFSKIKENKYKKNINGYKVLYVDKCMLILDINYTGIKPYEKVDMDNIIKVYYIKNQREFDYINNLYVGKGAPIQDYINKFNIYENNIIFASQAFSGSSGFTGPYSNITGPGFYYRESNGNWVNITYDLLNNTSYFNNILSPTYVSTNNIKRLIILNSGFYYNNYEWKENCVYYYDNNSNKWKIDIKYIDAFITKSHFMGRIFKGTWNGGVYGSFYKNIKWDGVNSKWKNGTSINTKYENGGIIESEYKTDESYYSELDENDMPSQRLNNYNNNGFGYNYFFMCDFNSIIINNGNFLYCNFNSNTPNSETFIENFHYNNFNLTTNSDINIYCGNFKFCNFNKCKIINSLINKCWINDSYIENSKSINSTFYNTVFNKSIYNSDSLIKILDYDEINYYKQNKTYKIYKFYINENDYKRLKNIDKFTIVGIKIKNDDGISKRYNKILNFFDRAFILDKYSDTDDSTINIPSDGSTQIYRNIICSLNTKGNNTYLVNTQYDDNTQTYINSNIQNSKNLPSLDIVVEVNEYHFGNHDYNTSIMHNDVYNNIDISSAYIIDSYFDSGLFINSVWNSGNLYNYNLDNRITGDYIKGTLDITYSNDKIYVKVPNEIIKGVKDEYFKINDIVYLNSVYYNNQTDTIIRLPDVYKITSISNIGQYKNLELTELYTNNSVIQTLPSSTQTVFLTLPDDDVTTNTGINRYNFLHKVLFYNSIIKSGILRRVYFKKCTFENDKYDNRNIEFKNVDNLKSLMIINAIMSRTSNIIKSGLFTDSYICGRGEDQDMWLDGIFWNSIWNNNVFYNGVVNNSCWINGIFKNGIFCNSKDSHYIDIKKFYFKSGDISSVNVSSTLIFQLDNNLRNVWINGSFENGVFYNSIWENGEFINGKFYNSNWLNGTFSNGIFGDDKINYINNNFYGGVFVDGVAINANFCSGYLSSDPINGPVSYPQTFNGIVWKNGVFKSGVFGNNTTTNYQAIWENGIFDGGEFTNTAIWLNGTFNNGKFTSYHGCTANHPSDSESDYSWVNGVFNGGVFGNADTVTNSTWFNGIMRGGLFVGKLWRNGIFISGEFKGSGSMSCIGDIDSADDFVDSFNNEYYGKWVNGIVTDVIDKYLKNVDFYDNKRSHVHEKRRDITKNKALIKNALWMGGIFDHKNGEMENVVWLDGIFENGLFKNSSFNPYVVRDNSNIKSFNLNDETCIWKNGTFDGGDFYISVWENGNFIMGTAYGMIWKNGICYYMNAFNICWDNGIWKNGNWNGSPFDYKGYIDDDFVKTIIDRVNNMCNKSINEAHIWNIFDNTIISSKLISDENASSTTIFNLIDIDNNNINNNEM